MDYTASGNSYQYIWNLSGLEYGDYQVFAKAIDNQGRESETQPVTLHYVDPNQDDSDTTGPNIVSLSPPEGFSVASNVQFSASVTDNESGVDYVEFYIDRKKVSTDHTYPYYVYVQTSFYSNGPHTFHVRAFDNAGNKTVAGHSFIIINSLGAPTYFRATMGNFSDRVIVGWNHLEGAETYEIYRSENSFFRCVGAPIGTARYGETRFTDTTMQLGVVQYYSLRGRGYGVTGDCTPTTMGYSNSNGR